MNAQPSDPAPDTGQLAAWLLTIDEDAFRDIVARDVHKHLDYDASLALRHPAVLVRWSRMLKVLIKDSHVQIEEKKRERSDDRTWFAKVARWEERLLHAKAEADSLTRRFSAQAQHASSLADKRARGEAREAAIARLINAHRAESDQILSEERALAGLPAKARPSTAVIPFSAPAEEGSQP